MKALKFAPDISLPLMVGIKYYYVSGICTSLDFLGIKDLKKTKKGQAAVRPNIYNLIFFRFLGFNNGLLTF